jgi:cell wall assembly regulator SMI1
MKNTNKKHQLLIAETFGLIAHELGRNRVPAQDKKLLQMFDGRNIGETPTGEASTMDLMKAWTNGWDKARSIQMVDRLTKEQAKRILQTPNAEYKNTEHNRKEVANAARIFIASLHGEEPHLIK